jgi:flagellar protein FlaJ
MMMGSAVAFAAIGLSLLPAGWYAWKDDSTVNKLDTEFPTFIRSLGNIAGASGVTLTEALKRIDTKSMGSLEPHIDRLKVRLAAGLPTQQCWDAFRAETGSELVKRTTQMMEDGSGLGGRPDLVGNICSSFAQNMVQLRAKRALTATTFSFLTLPMHGTMTFILVFVLEIISTFNTKLGSASAGLGDTGRGDFSVPEGLAIPPGVSLPAQGDLAGGLDLFGNQDMGLVTLMIVIVVLILTVANSIAPKAAAGGSKLKLVSYLGIMSLVSGFVLAVVPVVTGRIFNI